MSNPRADVPASSGVAMLGNVEVGPASAQASAVGKVERRTSPTGVVVEVPVIRPTASGRVDEKQAAAYLGCSTRWLRMRRERDELPDYERYCGRIWYRLDDLDAFQELSKHETSR